MNEDIAHAAAYRTDDHQAWAHRNFDRACKKALKFIRRGETRHAETVLHMAGRVLARAEGEPYDREAAA